MKNPSLLLLAGLVLAGSTAGAFAQPRYQEDQRHDQRRPQQMQDHRDNRYAEGHDWRRGERIAHDDWDRGRPVEYRDHHLQAPPRGYEWREVDGRFILAAVATGLIASIILSNH